MEIKSLSGREICAIIKTCRESGVWELTLGDLQIKFGTPVINKLDPSVGTQTPPPEFVETTQHPKTEQQKDSFIDALQARTAEDILSTQTLMDNPSQYEEDVANDLIYEGGEDVSEERR